MKLALIAKVRNGALLEVLREKAWNQSDLARACGVTPMTVSLWCQMRSFPKRQRTRERLEEVTGRLYEDLFPPEVQALAKDPFPRQVTAIREVDGRYLKGQLYKLALPSPEVEMVAAEGAKRLLEEALALLRPVEQRILRMRYGLGNYEPHTREAIGEVFGVSRERIRQIEDEAMQKLQRQARPDAIGRLHRWHQGGKPDPPPLPPREQEGECLDV